MRLPRNKSSRKKKILGLLIFLLLLFVAFSFSNWPNRQLNPAVSPSKETEFKQSLSEYSITPDNLDYRDTITLTLPGPITVWLAASSDLKYSVASLQFIISRSKIEGKVPKSIDLRYNKPVVVY